MDRDEGAGSQAFLDFFLSDDGAPFYMVNRDAEQGRTPEMETAAREYGALMMLGLVSPACYPVLSNSLDGWYSAPSTISPTVNPRLILWVSLLVIGDAIRRRRPRPSGQSLHFSQRGGS